MESFGLGDCVTDRRTWLTAYVVAGAQPDGYVTIRYSPYGADRDMHGRCAVVAESDILPLPEWF